MDFRNNKKQSFSELCRHYMAMLNVLRCAGITGCFSEAGLSPEERRKLLEELHQLEFYLATVKTKAKQESILST